MANPEHLTILKSGVKAWGEWRQQNRHVVPDLREAALRGARLNDMYLDLADLRDADLREAYLNQANLGNANLCGANLGETYLNEAYLDGANLHEANLGGADLREARLGGADLTEANLKEAYLDGTDLRDANLSGANLEDANIQYAQLSGCDLTGAKLTGVRLYGAARDRWVISGVECKYVFWDPDGRDRSPKDRDLAPGEFERLYRVLPTIEYIFENGMTPLDLLIMDRVVQTIRQQNREYDIKIDSISARGLAPSIKLTVQQEEQKTSALVAVTRCYENYIQRLQTDKEHLATLLAQSLENNRLQTFLLSGAVERIGDNIYAEAGANVATRGASIDIEEHVYHAVELQRLIAEQAPDSETFRKTAKEKVMDVIGGAIQDFAKGKVREAAGMIVDICKDLGPVIVNTAVYGFFKNSLGL